MCYRLKYMPVPEGYGLFFHGSTMRLHNRVLLDFICQNILDHLVILEHISAFLTLYAKVQGELMELLLPISRDTCDHVRR